MTPTYAGVREDCANTRETFTRHNYSAFYTRHLMGMVGKMTKMLKR